MSQDLLDHLSSLPQGLASLLSSCRMNGWKVLPSGSQVLHKELFTPRQHSKSVQKLQSNLSYDILETVLGNPSRKCTETFKKL